MLFRNACAQPRATAILALMTTPTGEAVDILGAHEQARALELAFLAFTESTQARIVELRFFGGLSVEEVAEVVGVSKRTVEGEWSHAKAWLRVELGRS